MRESYYDVLGLRDDADAEQIRHRYLALMRRYHPDVSHSPFAHARATKINEAARRLLDPADRAHHDAELARRRAEALSARAVALSRGSGRALVVRRERSWLRRYGARLALVTLLATTAVAAHQIERRLNGDGVAIGAVARTEAPDDEARQTVAALNAATRREAREMPRVSPAVVTGAAARFTRIAAAQGLNGAATVSRRCHADAQDAATWEALDACVAFDQAGYASGAMRAAGASGVSDYFVARHDRAAHVYVARLASMDSIDGRIGRIRALLPPPPDETLGAQTMRTMRRIAHRGWKLAGAAGLVPTGDAARKSARDF